VDPKVAPCVSLIRF